jgi:hypothetical protein
MAKLDVIVKWAIDMTSKHKVVVSPDLFGGNGNTLLRRRSVNYLKTMGVVVWPMPDGSHILSKAQYFTDKNDGKMRVGSLMYSVDNEQRIFFLPAYVMKDYNYL